MIILLGIVMIYVIIIVNHLCYGLIMIKVVVVIIVRVKVMFIVKVKVLL